MLLLGVRGCSASHQVGRVAPRPQNRGRDWTLLGGKPKKRVVAILSGPTEQWLTGDRRSRSDTPYPISRTTTK